ncbi:MAG: hypothetical protein IJS50_05515, partial [Desulfovibrio sp.]|nr:hypothetical protein [Desulfovibrio sp.]
MDEKINWYKEVLALEPNSKLFFPLARLLTKNGMVDEAISTLSRGLERHNEYLEARLYYIELLYRSKRLKEIEPELVKLQDMFAHYTGFWKAWAAFLAQSGSMDTSSIMRFLAIYFTHRDLSLHEIINKGLDALLREESLAKEGQAEEAMVSEARQASSAAHLVQKEDVAKASCADLAAGATSQSLDTAEFGSALGTLQATEAQKLEEPLQEKEDYQDQLAADLEPSLSQSLCAEQPEIEPQDELQGQPEVQVKHEDVSWPLDEGLADIAKLKAEKALANEALPKEPTASMDPVAEEIALDARELAGLEGVAENAVDGVSASGEDAENLVKPFMARPSEAVAAPQDQELKDASAFHVTSEPDLSSEALALDAEEVTKQEDFEQTKALEREVEPLSELAPDLAQTLALDAEEVTKQEDVEQAKALEREAEPLNELAPDLAQTLSLDAKEVSKQGDVAQAEV